MLTADDILKAINEADDPTAGCSCYAYLSKMHDGTVDIDGRVNLRRVADALNRMISQARGA